MSVFNQLPPAGKKLARIPRFGRLIGQMDDVQLDRLDSNAAVYWEVLTYVSHRNSETTGLLDTGLKSDGARLLGWHDEPHQLDRNSIRTRKWQVRLAFSFLSAVAFQMMCGADADGKPLPLDRIKNDDVEPFEDAVRDSMFASGAYVDENDEPLSRRMWSRDWEHIKKLNSGLDFILLSDSDSCILFSDISLRDFLAAYWATNWANAKQQHATQEWMPECVNPNSQYNEFWDSAVSLRSLQCQPGRQLNPYVAQKWESLVAPIYDIELQDDPYYPIRSTRLMFRTWQHMNGTHAKEKFLSEFGRLAKRFGVSGRTARAVYRRDLPILDRLKGLMHGSSQCDGEHCQFVQLANPNDQRDDWDSGVFLMGAADDDLEANSFAKPQHRVSLSPFALHRFCVSNLEYELFDPAHENYRHQNADRQPVVYVSWFAAWCFAKWIGSIQIEGTSFNVTLPTEAQWEYACRCGEATPYTWKDRRQGSVLRSDMANYSPNSPWPAEGQLRLLPDEHYGQAISVDGGEADCQLPPNPWGLHQMHGNVWEWCDDMFDRYSPEPDFDPTGRNANEWANLRGGSWMHGDIHMRSYTRHWAPLGYINSRTGFRLAAIPIKNETKKLD